MKDLKTVQMAGSVKNLCKYVNRHDALEPYEVVEMAARAGFDKATFKANIQAKQAEIDAEPKVTSYTMVLFSHPDIGTSFLAGLDDRIDVAAGWAFQVDVTLTAKSAADLKHGLDNPRILQKIKDAGDFPGMMRRVQEQYLELLKNDFDPTPENSSASLAVVESKAGRLLRRKKRAVDRPRMYER